MRPNAPAPAKEKRAWLHRLWMGTLCAGMALITGWSGAGAPLADTQAEGARARQGRITVYVQDSAGLDLSGLNAAHIDQLNFAFAQIVDGVADGSHFRSVDRVAQFLRRNPEVTGILSVGGWGAEGFSAAVSTAEGREVLAQSILDLMDAHGFLGVDLDWEYPGSGAGGLKYSADDWDNYYELMALLRKGLDARQEAVGRDYLLSAAVGASPALVEAVDGERLAALLDQVNVMTYDLTGFDRVTGHHAALWPDDEDRLGGAWAVRAYAEKGIPEGKLNLGAAFYGRAWRQVPDVADGLFQTAKTSGNRVCTYGEIAQMLLEDTTQRFWDEEAQAPWLFDGSTFVSYEDEASLAAKAAFVQAEGLLGVSCWSAEQDPTGALLAALDTAFCAE